MTDASRVNAYERQAHESRRRLASTLDELADNLTPGRVLDEVMSYARGGGGSFLKSLGNAATANPIPVALLGISAAMFLTGRGRLSSGPEESRGASVLRHAADRMSAPGQSKSYMDDAGAAASQAVRKAGSAIGDGAAAVGAAASGAVDAVGSAASSVAEQANAGVAAAGSMAADALGKAREGAAAVGGAVTDAGQKAASIAAHGVKAAGEAVGEVAVTTRKTVVEAGARVLERGNRISADVGERVKSLVQQQPLLVAAAGLAIGAAIAAALPRTKAEDSLMGDASDAVKDTVGQVASEQIETAKSVAGAVAEEIKKTVSEAGMSPEAAAGTVRNIGDKLKEAVSLNSSMPQNERPGAKTA